MKPPGPVSEVKEMLEHFSGFLLRDKKIKFLKDKWRSFLGYITNKHNVDATFYSDWCKWYITHCKKEKCKEILK